MFLLLCKQAKTKCFAILVCAKQIVDDLRAERRLAKWGCPINDICPRRFHSNTSFDSAAVTVVDKVAGPFMETFDLAENILNLGVKPQSNRPSSGVLQDVLREMKVAVDRLPVGTVGVPPTTAPPIPTGKKTR